MIGRNKRGIRRASTRVRLAVAAAVLVGGGAAGVAAVAASHNTPVNAASAGYYRHSHTPLSETHAMSDAMSWWHKSPSMSLNLISQMTPMRNVSMTPWHSHMLVLQRGTVVGATRTEFVIKSSNRQFEIWHANRGTAFLNVGGSSMGMNAMTGGGTSMAMPGQMHMNVGAKKLVAGDIVFIFGQRVHGELVAQLVLFVAPVKVTTTPTATPSMTATPTMTATPSMTASPNTTVNGTPAVSGTHS